MSDAGRFAFVISLTAAAFIAFLGFADPIANTLANGLWRLSH